MQVIENDHGVVGKKYQEEIKQLKDMFFSEMQVRVFCKYKLVHLLVYLDPN